MSLESAIAEMIEDRLLDLHTALPGRIQSYDAGTQTADVLPLVRVNGERLPVIPNVPIAFSRSRTAFLSFPLAAGDFVFLLFPEQSLGAWRALNGVETAPGDLRRHDLSGAVALPCLYPSSQALADVHTSNVVLGFDGGNQIHIKAGQIALGSESPLKTAATAEDVATQLNALKTAIAGWTPVAMDGGAALKAALTALFTTWPGTVASSNVKLG